MNPENKNYQLTERGERLKKNAKKIFVTALSGTTLSIPVSHAVAESISAPEMNGSQSVQMGPGDTLWETAGDVVEGGASHTAEVVEYTQNDPRNSEVAANGVVDAGETWIFPKEVVKKD